MNKILQNTSDTSCTSDHHTCNTQEIDNIYKNDNQSDIPKYPQESFTKTMLNFFKNVGFVMFGYFGSKTIGMIREIIISGLYNKDIQDVNLFATKIPMTVRKSIVDGAVENAFIPSFSQFDTDFEKSIWIANASILILLTLSLISLFLMISVNLWQPLVFHTKLIKNFMDIFLLGMPCLPLYFMSGSWVSILHNNNMFLHANLGQMIASAAMISTIWIGNIYYPGSHYPLAFSNPMGAIVHAMWQFYGVMILNNKIQQKKNYIINDILKIITAIIALAFIDMIIFHIVPALKIHTHIKMNLIKIIIGAIILHFVFLLQFFIYHMKNNFDNGVYGSMFFTSQNNTVTHKQWLTNKAMICCMITLCIILLFKNFTMISNIFIKLLIHNSFIQTYYTYWISFISWWLSCIIFAKHMPKAIRTKFVILLLLYSLFKRMTFVYNTVLQLMILTAIAIEILYICRSTYKNSTFMSENKEFFTIILNSMIGTSATHIMHAISCSVTSRIDIGTASYINRSDRILALVNAVAVAPALVLLPIISAKVHQKKLQEAIHIFQWSVMITVITSMPILFLCIKYNYNICKILFFVGKTKLSDIPFIARAFIIQLYSVPAYMLIKSTHIVYLASHNSDFIAKSSFIQLIVDSTLKVGCLMYGFGMESIVICTSISSWFIAIYLLLNLKSQLTKVQ